MSAKVVVEGGSKEHIRAWELYLGGCIGALLLSIGDLVNNGNASVVLKISQAVKMYIQPNIETGGIWAMLILVLLGSALCWVHEPGSRIDAFTRGGSVFAVMAVITPLHGPQVASVQGWFIPGIISSAYADGLVPAGSAPDRVRTEVVIDSAANSAEKLITVREPQSAKILSISKSTGDRIVLDQPAGQYVIEIEGEGLRRSRAEIEVGSAPSSAKVKVEESAVPINIQRLYAPNTVEVK